ncbi:hypothetical protein [Calothrix sp. NIES-2098]|uniref:hypothetical protein n=1 Tax=Calothrix sp. NIES-2098 TaxID=1954171 RepID=UPI0030DD4823
MATGLLTRCDPCQVCSRNFTQLLPTKLVLFGLVIILLRIQSCGVVAIAYRLEIEIQPLG